MGSRVAYDVHSNWCTTMAYTVDGTRFIHSVVSIVGLHHALPLLSNFQTFSAEGNVFLFFALLLSIYFLVEKSIEF